MVNLVAETAHVNSPTPKSAKAQRSSGSPSKRRRKAGDYTRRGRWMDEITDQAGEKGLSRGALALAMTVTRWAGATLNAVWGEQSKLADLAQCSPSQFRANMKELEDAGFIQVERTEAERGPDGKWFRRLTNVYRFIVPPRPKKQQKSWSNAPRDLGGQQQENKFLSRQIAFNHSRIVDNDLPDDIASIAPGDMATIKATLMLESSTHERKKQQYNPLSWRKR